MSSVNRNLLGQIRRSIAEILATAGQSSLQLELGSADIVLNELMLRVDGSFYADHLATGIALLREGHSLAGRNTEPENETAVPGSSSSADSMSETLIIQQRLVGIMADIQEGRSAAERDFLDRVCAWEAAFYAHSLQTESMDGDQGKYGFDKIGLASYLSSKFPEWRDLSIVNLEMLTGGFSKRTILLETQDRLNGPQSFIIRAEIADSFMKFSTVVEEYPAIELLHKAGVPVPELLLLETDASIFGGPFIIMHKAPGKNYGVTLGGKDDISATLLSSIIENVANLHTVKVERDDPLAQNSPLAEWMAFSSSQQASRHYVRNYLPGLMKATDVAMTPMLLRLLTWLENNIPFTPEPPVILHLDLALNNMLIDDDRVSVILDWESIKMGDPAEDLTTTYQAVSKFISLPDFLQRYGEVSGIKITEYQMAYANIAKHTLYLIMFFNALRTLQNDRPAPIKIAWLAFHYLGSIAPLFNMMISQAEALQDRVIADAHSQ